VNVCQGGSRGPLDILVSGGQTVSNVSVQFAVRLKLNPLGLGIADISLATGVVGFVPNGAEFIFII
jgi:hypothetical protein